jgi:hypothetical protein
MRLFRASYSVWIALVLVLPLAVALCDCAQATTLVSLNPDLGPSGPQPATFMFGVTKVPSFVAGPGSVGNGDGNLPLASQSPPGLELKTPLTITNADGSNSYGRQSNGDGSTTFYDTTLILTGLAASGPSTTFNPGVQFDFQSLGSGGFTIYQSQAGGYSPSSPPPVLLSGTIVSATISGIDGSNIGNMLTTTVAYTGGAIFNKLVAQGGSTTGSLTVNLGLINAPLPQSPVFAIGGPPGFLLPFSATGQAIFDTPKVPEPSTAVLVLSGGISVLALRRIRRTRTRAAV